MRAEGRRLLIQTRHVGSDPGPRGGPACLPPSALRRLVRASSVAAPKGSAGISQRFSERPAFVRRCSSSRPWIGSRIVRVTVGEHVPRRSRPQRRPSLRCHVLRFTEYLHQGLFKRTNDVPKRRSWNVGSRHGSSKTDQCALVMGFGGSSGWFQMKPSPSSRRAALAFWVSVFHTA